MQNVIPAAAEVPSVSLITEVRAYTGQNQIRRNVGLFTQNNPGQYTDTAARILAPGASAVYSNIAAFVLSASAKLEVTLAYELVAGTPLTAVVNSSLMQLDQGLTSITLKNNQSTAVEFTLLTVGPAPVLT